MRELKHLPHEERPRELGLQLGESFVHDLIKVYKCLPMGVRESKEDIVGLVSVVSSNRTGGNRHKMECKKPCLSRTGCRVSILKDIQNLTRHNSKKPPALPDDCLD